MRLLRLACMAFVRGVWCSACLVWVCGGGSRKEAASRTTTPSFSKHDIKASAGETARQRVGRCFGPHHCSCRVASHFENPLKLLLLAVALNGPASGTVRVELELTVGHHITSVGFPPPFSSS
ncbi:hypothetical protein CCHR01_17562 [Colletotrichum chrysophilum]|uniref:Secreted protein n=1 Tax=Colletotrichum chrysophilum TaxID=1836956 RepID=A0AAD9A2A9_9PEZI|nr:hypothetical protein CCHR01_17562 [Colletotrichum chrysophilum]